jgi:hypothetical protein
MLCWAKIAQCMDYPHLSTLLFFAAKFHNFPSFAQHFSTRKSSNNATTLGFQHIGFNPLKPQLVYEVGKILSSKWNSEQSLMLFPIWLVNVIIKYFFLVLLEFELGALCLWGRSLIMNLALSVRTTFLPYYVLRDN